MRQLSSLLETHRTGMKEDMAALIQTSSQSLRVSMDALRGDVISFHFERLTSAEATIKSMQSQNKLLYDRVEDLENRSRRLVRCEATSPDPDEECNSAPHSEAFFIKKGGGAFYQ